MPARKTIDKAVAEELQFEYPNKEMNVEVVDKLQSRVIDDKGSEAVLMTGSAISFGLPMLPDRIGFINPFTEYAKYKGYTDNATRDKYARLVQKRLEEDLGLPTGYLNATIVTREQLMASPWRMGAFKVVFKKQTKQLSSATLKLNLNDPADFIKFIICLASPKCANNWDERKKRNSYLVTLRDVAAHKETQLNRFEMAAKIATKLYSWLDSDNNNEGSNILYTVYNMFSLKAKESDRSWKPFSATLSSKSDAKDYFVELSENAQIGKYGKILHDMLGHTAETLDGHTAFFRAREKGMFSERSGRYYKDGEDLGTIHDVIKWLSLPENNALRAGIKDK